MPGVNLNLDLPSLTDPMATAIAKLVTALQAVEDDLAGKILPSEININAALSMNGNALTNIGSLQMLAGNAPTAAGSIYYSNGEFYAIDAAGTIRLTLNGALDITATGGFVGDYGQPGVNAAASYDNASQEYRFYSDGGLGTWADLVCDDLVLEGTNGSVRLGVDAAINTARQVLFKSLPTTGVGLLVYNSATSTVEDLATTSPTAISVTCPVTTTQAVTAGDLHFTNYRVHIVPPHRAVEIGGNTHTRQEFQIVLDNSTNELVFPIELPVGANIAGYKLYLNKASPAGYLQARMRKYNSTSGVLSNVGSGVSTGAVNGFVQIIDGTALGTIATGEHWYVYLSMTAVGYSDAVLQLEVSYKL